MHHTCAFELEAKEICPQPTCLLPPPTVSKNFCPIWQFSNLALYALQQPFRVMDFFGDVATLLLTYSTITYVKIYQNYLNIGLLYETLPWMTLYWWNFSQIKNVRTKWGAWLTAVSPVTDTVIMLQIFIDFCWAPISIVVVSFCNTFVSQYSLKLERQHTWNILDWTVICGEALVVWNWIG